MPAHTIVLADDHALIRQGLKKIIEEDPSLQVIGEVGDGLELLQLLRDLTPDLIVLDISMPNLRGIEAIAEAKKLCPRVRILILTMHKNEQYFNCAMSAGADGYMLKEDSDSELLSAIATVLDGEVYISSYFSEVLSDETIVSYKNKEWRPPTEALTTRERQVLKLVAEGETSRDIATKLSISTRTVEHHRANLMKKLNLKNAADLIRYAISKGYVSQSS
ncbi:MAG: response regulator transcription factor [Thermodesulfobacteriota bacterium]